MNANKNGDLMYDAIPSVAELNKVPGFDPRKFLRRTISETSKEEVQKLDLKYKKLWFRLAHPTGRIKMSALRITDQLAIIEARVYLDKRDPEPVASFTSSRSIKNTPGGLYVQAAQYEAQDVALTDAGFGLQFCDVNQAPGEERFGTEIPMREAQKTAPEATTPDKQNVSPVAEDSPAPEQDGWVEMPESEFPEQAAAEPLRTTEAEAPDPQIRKQADQSPASVPVGAAASVENTAVSTVSATERVSAEMPQTRNPVENVPASESQRAVVTEFPAVPVRGDAPAEETAAEQAGAPSYTPDMPVEEILSMMTLEEAQNLIVDVGTCSGWTMAQVADRRAASLKWYVYGYKGDNNILRAAAQMMLEFSTAQKAG
ncbi:hypothetical protein [Caproicibacter sp. BJN0012]|uniref:hypothetical protein n=1 Tax=Caproicibacter sp. BJN0012 TaxID=3110227 RepID=UPI002E13662D